MKIIKNVTRFSRPASTSEPYRYKGRDVTTAAVHIGQHPPTAYYTKVSHEFVVGLEGVMTAPSTTDRR